MNVIQMEKGRERWSMLDENTWNMILGQQGQLLGPVGEEIIALANEQGRSFFTGDPQELYPDQLEVYRAKMLEKGWETGADDEELFQYAMHPTQYEAYKSGEAKLRFEDELSKKRHAAKPVAESAPMPSTIEVELGGERYTVHIAYPETAVGIVKATETSQIATASIELQVINAPLEGKFFLTKNPGERGIQIGDVIQKGDTIAYVEAMKVINAISSEYTGTVAEILVQPGSDVEEDQPIIKLK